MSAHRRVQSTVPLGPGATFPQNQINSLGNLSGLNMGLDGQTAGIPRGHGRRHSVNVLNKAVGQSIGSFEDGNFEPFEDGFNAPGQQQRGVYLRSFLTRFQLISFRSSLHHTVQ